MLTILIVFSSVLAMAQDDIVVVNQTSGYKDSLVFFAAENWLVIKYNPKKYGKIKLRFPNKEYKIDFEKYSNDTFFIKLVLYSVPLGQNSFGIVNEKGVLVKKVNFSLHKYPECYVGLQRLLTNSSVIPKHKVSLFKGLSVFWEDQNYKAHAIVKSFTVTINNMNNYVVSVSYIKGSLFPRDILKLLSQMPSNAVLEFSDIIVSMPPAGCSRSFGDVTYLIK